VTGLNTFGVAPNDLSYMLSAIEAAGALHAEFVAN